MVFVPRFVVPAVLVLSAVLSAQTGFFPLKDVRAGMRGTGRTIFSGDRIEEFTVEDHAHRHLRKEVRLWQQSA
jgi:hypothetical protein